MRVVLADDHALFRAGIRRLLEDLHGVEVLAEADNGLAVPALVELHAPDAVILDLSMPGISGFSGLIYLRAQYPAIPVVIVSASDASATSSNSAHAAAGGSHTERHRSSIDASAYS